MDELESIRVVVDEDLADLIPGYLQRRESDVVTIRAAIASGDFETIRLLGHSMRGSGGGYGFDTITDIGKALEQAGKAADPAAASTSLCALEAYLQKLEVVYE
jgi:HPt (histidine-containing phosphotransfer) domain-containing protein